MSGSPSNSASGTSTSGAAVVRWRLLRRWDGMLFLVCSAKAPHSKEPATSGLLLEGGGPPACLRRLRHDHGSRLEGLIRPVFLCNIVPGAFRARTIVRPEAHYRRSRSAFSGDDTD